MRNSLLLFLVLNAITIALGWLTGGLSMELQLGLAAVLIGLVGIPHGAIDHILFLQNNKQTSSVKFYAFYFSLILLVILVWVYSPIVGLIGFLALSAYHFGQSQFVRYKGIKKPVKVFLYSTWGMAILAGLCVFNQAEIQTITSSAADLLKIKPVFEGTTFQSLLILCSISFAAVVLSYRNTIGWKTVLYELAVFGLIQLSLVLNPLLIGFSIYFASLHSWHVLQEEFRFLSKRMKAFNCYNFVALLTPYTLVSLVGLVMLLTLSHYEFINVSKTLVVFITISALTLPHSVVMENFYNSTSLKRINRKST
jgi:Brp/Blh family beta-carotene 15,15'-monooxygenase